MNSAWTKTVQPCPTGTPGIQFANQLKTKCLLYPGPLFLSSNGHSWPSWLFLCIPTKMTMPRSMITLILRKLFDPRTNRFCYQKDFTKVRTKTYMVF